MRCSLLSSGLTAQTRLVALFGGPIAPDAVGDVSNPLPFSVIAAQLDGDINTTLGYRIGFWHGLGWPLYHKTLACEGCDPRLDELDPALFNSDTPIAASLDLTLSSPKSPFVPAAIAGIGLGFSPEGKIDQAVPTGYRIESHTAPFLSLGAEVVYELTASIGVAVQARGFHFLVGEQPLTPGTYRDFEVDIGGINGLVVAVGLSIAV